MDLGDFLEQDILLFLEQKMEQKRMKKDIAKSITYDEAADLYAIQRDYSKELQQALADDNLAKAKRIFDELKSAYNKIPKSNPNKRKAYLIMEELYSHIKNYLEQTGKEKSLNDEIFDPSIAHVFESKHDDLVEKIEESDVGLVASGEEGSSAPSRSGESLPSSSGLFAPPAQGSRSSDSFAQRAARQSGRDEGGRSVLADELYGLIKDVREVKQRLERDSSSPLSESSEALSLSRRPFVSAINKESIEEDRMYAGGRSSGEMFIPADMPMRSMRPTSQGFPMQSLPSQIPQGMAVPTTQAQMAHKVDVLTTEVKMLHQAIMSIHQDMMSGLSESRSHMHMRQHAHANAQHAHQMTKLQAFPSLQSLPSQAMDGVSVDSANSAGAVDSAGIWKMDGSGVNAPISLLMQDVIKNIDSKIDDEFISLKQFRQLELERFRLKQKLEEEKSLRQEFFNKRKELMMMHDHVTNSLRKINSLLSEGKYGEAEKAVMAIRTFMHTVPIEVREELRAKLDTLSDKIVSLQMISSDKMPPSMSRTPEEDRRYREGLALYTGGGYEQARSIFKDILARNPNHFAAKIRLKEVEMHIAKENFIPVPESPIVDR